MSVRIQTCGIFVLLILMYFQGRQRRTNLATERVFRLLLRATLVSLLLDVGSVWGIYLHFEVGSVPLAVTDFICKLYTVSLLVMGMSTLLYICVEIYPQWEQYQRRMLTYAGLVAIGAVGIFVLPIEYARDGLDGHVTNTEGPAIILTHVLIAAFLGLIIYHLVRDRARLNRRRRGAVIMWMGLWVGSFLIQMLYDQLLLAGFASALGVLIIYLSLENPEANLDKQTGLFTHTVLVSLLNQMYAQERDFAALVLNFDAAGQRYGQSEVEKAKLEVIRYLEAQHELMVFKDTDDRLVMIFDTPREARKAQEKVAEAMERRWRARGSRPVKLRWMLIPSGKTLDSRQEFLSALKHVSGKYIMDKTTLEVDEQLVGEVRRDRRVENLLRAAVEGDRIEVFYQPIYSAAERRITSAEALVRIRDEAGNLVPPGLFIPIAESNGMILRLGKAIFEQVCRFVREHPPEELGLHYVAVNLSVVQCADPNLATDFIDIMRRFGIDPKQINLEITESASTDEKNILLKNMDKLIAYGVSFSLDDFGTGQSNLDYIMDMPVTTAKFDREMTQAYFVNEKAKQVMTAAIRMIHGMGLRIVSEGVETIEELRVIQGLDIDAIQGFYFSKPLPKEEFLSYLESFTPPPLDETA